MRSGFNRAETCSHSQLPSEVSEERCQGEVRERERERECEFVNKAGVFGLGFFYKQVGTFGPCKTGKLSWKVTSEDYAQDLVCRELIWGESGRGYSWSCVCDRQKNGSAGYSWKIPITDACMCMFKRQSPSAAAGDVHFPFSADGQCLFLETKRLKAPFNKIVNLAQILNFP